MSRLLDATVNQVPGSVGEAIPNYLPPDPVQLALQAGQLMPGPAEIALPANKVAKAEFIPEWSQKQAFSRDLPIDTVVNAVGRGAKNAVSGITAGANRRSADARHQATLDANLAAEQRAEARERTANENFTKYLMNTDPEFKAAVEAGLVPGDLDRDTLVAYQKAKNSGGRKFHAPTEIEEPVPNKPGVFRKRIVQSAYDGGPAVPLATGGGQPPLQTPDVQGYTPDGTQMNPDGTTNVGVPPNDMARDPTARASERRLPRPRRSTTSRSNSPKQPRT
jgi:hypothetical protein